MFELTTPAPAGKGYGALHCWKMLLSLGLGVAGAGYAAYRFYNANQKKLVQVVEEEIIKKQLQAQFEEVKEEEEEEEEGQQVLPPLPEAGRDWKSYYYRNWDHILPPPTLQLSSSLPRIPRQPNKTKWSGVCSLHCYGETLTALLRLAYHQDVGFNVNYLAFILSAAGRGFLRETGASIYSISLLIAQYGIPFEASTHY